MGGLGPHGVESVAVGYLDDRYGRALKDVLVEQIRGANEVTLQTQVGFSADQEELGPVAQQLLAGGPGVVVVLGDADDGTRLLQALDDDTSGVRPPLVVVNDAIRDGRQGIQSLSSSFRARLSGVAPLATTKAQPGPEGFFTANAAFHDTLVARADNADLKTTYDALMDRMRRYRWPSLDLRGGMERSTEEHDAILRAIRAGDSDEAVRLLAAHIHVPQKILEEEGAFELATR